MKPIETIEKELRHDNCDIIIKGELFEEKMFSNNGEDIKARVSFTNKENGHLIGHGAMYFPNVNNKDALSELVEGCSNQINDIIPCL